jgi:DNA repair protein RecO (recombination protein O)
LLQPFIPLLLSFSGRTELKTLTAAEAVGEVLELRGERMFSGMYVNELLVRLLHQHDAHPKLFAAYARTLQALAGSAALDTLLRHFEFTLLHELGYRFDLNVDGASGAQVREDLWYHYDPDCGLVASRGAATDPSRPAFAGSDLLVMAGGEFGGPVRLTAKRLLRQALATHLGDAPLRSRDLFHTGSAIPTPAQGQVELNTGDKL